MKINPEPSKVVNEAVVGLEENVGEYAERLGKGFQA